MITKLLSFTGCDNFYWKSLVFFPNLTTVFQEIYVLRLYVNLQYVSGIMKMFTLLPHSSMIASRNIMTLGCNAQALYCDINGIFSQCAICKSMLFWFAFVLVLFLCWNSISCIKVVPAIFENGWICFECLYIACMEQSMSLFPCVHKDSTAI